MVMRDRLVKIVPSGLVTVLAHATRLDSVWHQRCPRVDRVGGPPRLVELGPTGQVVFKLEECVGFPPLQ